MTRPGAPAPTPGDVLELAEPQYKFGAGPVVCRIGTVLAGVNLDGRLWWHVRGQCKRGTVATLQDVVPWTERELYVEASAVRSRRRVGVDERADLGERASLGAADEPRALGGGTSGVAVGDATTGRDLLRRLP